MPVEVELSPGERVAGRYLVRERLAERGEGSWYLAIDERTFAEVTLQLGQTSGGSLTRITRFLHRAQRLRRLDHPNVARVLDAGSWQGLFYVVEQWLPGRTLHELLAWGPLPMEGCLSIGRQVAGGLSAAHAIGLSHGALNPRRVVLVGNAVAWLTSFALLRPALSGPLRPGEEPVLTAPGYTAPERLAGRADEGSAEDAWALGALLYEMLSGTAPADGDRPAHLRPLSEVAPSTPPQVLRVVDDLLARTPDRRPLSLDAVGASLLKLQRTLWGAPTL